MFPSDGSSGTTTGGSSQGSIAEVGSGVVSNAGVLKLNSVLLNSLFVIVTPSLFTEVITFLVLTTVVLPPPIINPEVP